MNTNMNSIRPKVTSGELVARINAHIHELAQATDAVHALEEILRYLEACSNFHQYSLFNMWLILMNRTQATLVAGYRKWGSMNRYVRKGEHGIHILAPILISKEEEDITPEKTVFSI